MKLRGFGHNKLAYCRIMCRAGVLEVTQTKGPLRANTQLCVCLPALTLCYLVLRALRPRWERGRCAGWIFIWERHLRLCALHYACNWCAVSTALFGADSIVINSGGYSAVFWSQVPTLFAYPRRRHTSEWDGGETQRHHNNGRIVGGETFFAAQSVTLALEIRRKLLVSALPGLSIVWDIMKALSASWNPFPSRSIWSNVICLIHI